MFSLANASKIGFVAPRLFKKNNNYKLLDCQVHNDHLEKKLGAFEISRDFYADFKIEVVECKFDFFIFVSLSDNTLQYYPRSNK
jgi:Leu/Phe-tRNA-protein transferase